jgi:hypothetical protein
MLLRDFLYLCTAHDNGPVKSLINDHFIKTDGLQRYTDWSR